MSTVCEKCGAEKPKDPTMPRGMGDLERLVWKHIAKNGSRTTRQMAAEIGHGVASVQTAVYQSKHMESVVALR